MSLDVALMFFLAVVAACVTLYAINRDRMAVEQARLVRAQSDDAIRAELTQHADKVAGLQAAIKALHERNDAQVRNLAAEVKTMLSEHESKLSGIVATAAHGGTGRGRFIGGRQA